MMINDQNGTFSAGETRNVTKRTLLLACLDLMLHRLYYEKNISLTKPQPIRVNETLFWDGPKMESFSIIYK